MLRTFLLIVVGLAGDPEHGELFRKWTADLAAASQQLGVSRERIAYLGESAAGDLTPSGPATREGIEQAFAALAPQVAADDLVMVVLFGHGSFDGRLAKFNVRGPDPAAADFAPLLARLPSRHVVFVNTASASGPFVEALAAPDRTIITATRSGSEQFATLFGGFFVDALTSDAADADKNRRVTVREAFDHAKGEVARAYEREGLLATEHPLIEDPRSAAATLALGTADAADALPADPAVRALHVERRALERRLESLKLLKGSMDPQRYLAELEKAATALALKTREIRQAEGKQ
jgi:hypothetical protein